MTDDTTGVAIVTGSARGIGAAIAEKLARSGYRVVVADVDESLAREHAESIGGGAVGRRLDVTDPTSVRELADDVEGTVGPVSLLVNNAGVLSVVPTLELSFDEWRRVLDVNLSGAFLCAQAFGRGMVERRAGSIVNIASVAGRRGDPQMAHYTASKFGIVGLTQSLAREWGPYGVRANSVCPGLVETPMLQQLQEGWQLSTAELAQEHALGTAQTPADIADAVLFLARMPAMTGQSLVVDGGYYFA